MPHVIALIGMFLPFLFSWVGAWQAYDIVKDLLIVILAFSAHSAVPFRQYTAKAITSFTFVCASLATIHNLAIDFELISYPIEVFASFLFNICIVTFFSTFVLYRYDDINNDDLLKGKFYHIYGRPRYGLGMIAFYLSLGTFGEHYITNGVYVWKFCKLSGEFERVLFEPKYVNNRKLVLIRGDISDKLNSKLGSNWSLINNCLTLIFIALRLRK